VAIDDDILAFAARRSGSLPSVLPLLDHLSAAHPDLLPTDLVHQLDAALDRLYRARRAFFAGHRWLDENPPSVAGSLIARLSDLHFDPTTRTWSWTGTAWTDNITIV
jgi:hypothetical protein